MPLTCDDSFPRELDSMISSVYPMKQYRFECLGVSTGGMVDLDTGQVLGVVDGRDHTGIGAWLIQRPLQWHLGEHARGH